MPHINLNGVFTKLPYPGKVFWVNNSSIIPDEGAGGFDTKGGGTYLRPFKTIDFAIGQCLADRGDVIYAMPGHVETVDTDHVIFDVAGVSCIGLGSGENQARFKMANLTKSVQINSADVTISNMNFRVDVAGSVVIIGLIINSTSSHALITDCLFDFNLQTDNFGVIISIDEADFTTVENCVLVTAAGASTGNGILLSDTSEGAIIRNNKITGDYDASCIGNQTALSTNVLIENNLLVQGYTDDLNPQPVLELFTGTTGIVRNNDIVCDVATFALMTIGDTVSFLNNQRTDDIAQAKVSTTISASVTVSADA